jgi:small subunit ribosomal protein S20
LARHLSAMKRARQNKKRRVRNQARKTRVKNVVRDVRQAVAQKNLEGAEAALQKARLPARGLCIGALRPAKSPA